MAGEGDLVEIDGAGIEPEDLRGGLDAGVVLLLRRGIVQADGALARREGEPEVLVRGGLADGDGVGLVVGVVNDEGIGVGRGFAGAQGRGAWLLVAITFRGRRAWPSTTLLEPRLGAGQGLRRGLGLGLGLLEEVGLLGDRGLLLDALGLALLPVLGLVLVEAAEVLDPDAFEHLVAVLHLLDDPAEGEEDLLRLGHEWDGEVGQVLVGLHLHDLGIDHDEAHLLGREAVEEAGDDGVDADRLTGTGGPGDEEVRHGGEVADDGLPVDVLPEGERDLGLRRGEGVVLEELAEGHGDLVRVRDLDPDGVAPGDGCEDVDGLGAGGAGDVGLQRGDAAHAKALTRVDLVAGDGRAFRDVAGADLDPEGGEGLDDRGLGLPEDLLVRRRIPALGVLGEAQDVHGRQLEVGEGLGQAGRRVVGDKAVLLLLAELLGEFLERLLPPVSGLVLGDGGVDDLGRGEVSLLQGQLGGDLVLVGIVLGGLDSVGLLLGLAGRLGCGLALGQRELGMAELAEPVAAGLHPLGEALAHGLEHEERVEAGHHGEAGEVGDEEEDEGADHADEPAEDLVPDEVADPAPGAEREEVVPPVLEEEGLDLRKAGPGEDEEREAPEGAAAEAELLGEDGDAEPDHAARHEVGGDAEDEEAVAGDDGADGAD